MNDHAGSALTAPKHADSDQALLADVAARLSLVEPPIRRQLVSALCGEDDGATALLLSAVSGPSETTREEAEGDADSFLATGGALQGPLRRRFQRWVESDDGETAGRWLGHRLGELRIEKLIGYGGMGEVYEARDERLDRTVAVKTIRARGQHPELSRERFRREARLLSQLNHPGICQVYRLVEGKDDEQGIDFLVLELVEGTPLSQRDGDAWPERQVMKVGIEIAHALEAAHRKRIVHRDLKPANVVLTPEGRAKVLDFGIARLVDRPAAPSDSPASDPQPSAGSGKSADSLTTLGSVVGTIAYMSPEQARGEDLTEASDLFALGVLLQELLGQPAYGDETSRLALLPRVAEADTQPVVGIDPDLAMLIATLESSDPADRPTAGATAKRLEWILRKPERRRRRLVLAALGVALAGALLWGGWTWFSAQKRERLATSLGQRIATMESLARTSAMLPLHSVERERAVIRQRMAEIDAETQSGSAAIRALGAYAMGRGHMALADFESARTSLERAWDLGSRGPETSLALSEVLGRLYSVARQEAELLSDDALRDQRLKEIRQELRDPALSYLEGFEDELSDYQRGLVALFESNYDAAVELAEAAHAIEPWRYEALSLKAEAGLAAARSATRSGEVDGAKVAFDLAEASFEEALQIARSDPRLHLGLCQIATGRLRLLQSTDIEEVRDDAWVEEGRKACRAAQVADPTSSKPWLWESQIHYAQGVRALNNQESARPWLKTAVELADRALKLDPDDPLTVASAGWARSHLGYALIVEGIDSTVVLRKAVDLLEKQRMSRPEDPTILSPLGRALTLLGWEMRNRGMDSREVMDLAVEVARSALARHPAPAQAAHALGSTLVERAELETHRSVDPRPTLREAANAFALATRENPNKAISYQGRGRVLASSALWAQTVGDDPRTAAQEARQALELMLELDPTSVAARTEIANSYLAEMRWAIEHEQSADQAIRRAQEAFEEAVREGPDFTDGRISYASYLEDVVSWRLSRGEKVEADLKRAFDNAAYLTRKLPSFAESHALEARLHALRAQSSEQEGKPPSVHIRRGFQAVAQSLDLIPEHHKALEARGWLKLLEARSLPQGPERLTHLRDAVQDLESSAMTPYRGWELLDSAKEEIAAHSSDREESQ